MPRFGPHILIPESHVFFRNAHALAIVNLRPVLPGHVLVLSTRVEARFAGLTPEEVASVWQAAQRVGGVVCAVRGGSAATFSMQDGAAAGQSVPHVHVHVVPRADGDLARNDDVYDLLEASESALAAGGGAAAQRAAGGGARRSTALAVDAPTSAAGRTADILPAELRRQRTPAEMDAEAEEYRRAFAALEAREAAEARGAPDGAAAFKG